MKKQLIAAALSVALLTGAGAAQADSYRLASGTELPLGDTVAVHEGQDSYLAKHVSKALADPELAKTIEKGIVDKKIFAPGDQASPKEAAEEAVSLLQRAKASQLQSRGEKSQYTALALSVVLTKEDLGHFQNLEQAYRKAHPEALPSAGSKTLEALYASMTSWVKPEQKEKAENLLNNLPIPESARKKIASYIDQAGSDAALPGAALALGKDWDKGIASGIPYMITTKKGNPDAWQTGWPMEATILMTTSREGLCLTLFAYDEANGAYFAPLIQNHAEAMK
jgi:hypothetical protein